MKGHAFRHTNTKKMSKSNKENIIQIIMNLQFQSEKHGALFHRLQLKYWELKSKLLIIFEHKMSAATETSYHIFAESRKNRKQSIRVLTNN